MPGITHNEVRRHPRWREEQNTPVEVPRVTPFPRSRLLALVGVLIVASGVARSVAAHSFAQAAICAGESGQVSARAVW